MKPQTQTSDQMLTAFNLTEHRCHIKTLKRQTQASDQMLTASDLTEHRLAQRAAAEHRHGLRHLTVCVCGWGVFHKWLTPNFELR